MQIPFLPGSHGDIGAMLMVPLIGQIEVTNDSESWPQNDPNAPNRPTGNNACWYACARMIGAYFGVQRRGLSNAWFADRILTVLEFSNLARVEGLRPAWSEEEFNQLKPAKLISQERLAKLLRESGPIWIAGNFGSSLSVGHAVVITGVMHDRVYYNDPWEPSAKSHTISWFKQNVVPNRYAVLVRA